MQTNLFETVAQVVEPLLLQNFESKAQQAHNWTSFSPERRGKQLIEDYSSQLSEDITELEAQNIEKEQIDNFTARYKNLFSSWLGAKSNCFSTMITGSSGVNVRKHAKANKSEERHYEIFQEWRTRAKKAIIRKSKPVATYSSELDRYKADLESMRTNHELMKQGNRLISKKTPNLKDQLKELLPTLNDFNIEWAMKWGFGLANNNANMKRVEMMIKNLEYKETQRQTEPEQELIFNGGKVVFNYEIDRIQIFFDNRPTSEELAQWKAKGLSSFNWSPSTKSWMRKITGNAIFSTKLMLKENIT